MGTLLAVPGVLGFSFKAVLIELACRAALVLGGVMLVSRRPVARPALAAPRNAVRRRAV